MNGRYRNKNSVLKDALRKSFESKKSFSKISFRHTHRENDADAESLEKMAVESVIGMLETFEEVEGVVSALPLLRFFPNFCLADVQSKVGGFLSSSFYQAAIRAVFIIF